MILSRQGLPPVAVEYLEDGKRCYKRAIEEDNDDLKDFWLDKAEENFDGAAFCGVPREYIEYIKRKIA